MPRPRHYGLTQREDEVLTLLREGLTNEQIASRLGITFETAKHHVSQVLAKLGVATREEAAAWPPEAEAPRWTPWRIAVAIGGTAVFAAAVAGLALLAWGVSRSGQEAEGSSVAGILSSRVVYLPPEDEDEWIAPPELVEAAGIDVLPGIWQLDAPVDVAIIDREWWDIVTAEGAWGWGVYLKDQGTVFVGARVNMVDLVAGLDAGVAGPGFGEYPPDRNFYSTLYSCGGSYGGAQDHLDTHPLSEFRLMLHRLQGQSDAASACR